MSARQGKGSTASISQSGCSSGSNTRSTTRHNDRHQSRWCDMQHTTGSKSLLNTPARSVTTVCTVCATRKNAAAPRACRICLEITAIPIDMPRIGLMGARSAAGQPLLNDGGQTLVSDGGFTSREPKGSQRPACGSHKPEQSPTLDGGVRTLYVVVDVRLDHSQEPSYIERL